MFEMFIALGAGLISFLSPCVLPLIPGYISFISGQSLNAFYQSQGVHGANSMFIEGGTETLGGLGGTVGATGGEVALSIIAEVANAQWNSKQYNEGKTIKRKGLKISWEQQNVKDRVTNVRSLLKPELERLTRKFSHWLISHNEFAKGVQLNEDVETLAAKALRARKHWAQSVGSFGYKYLCEFHEVIIGTANVEWEKLFGDQVAAEKRETVIKEESKHSTTVNKSNSSCMSRFDELVKFIDNHLKNHDEKGPCSGYCYMSTSQFAKCIGNSEPDTNSGELPIKPIGAKPSSL